MKSLGLGVILVLAALAGSGIRDTLDPNSVIPDLGDVYESVMERVSE